MSSAAVDFKRIPERSVGALHLFLILGLSAGGAALLGAILWQGVEKTDLEIYLALLLFYAGASAVFVRSYFRGRHLPLFDLPVFLTVLCFLRFGLVPLADFLDPADFLKRGMQRVDYGQLDRTLFLFVLGMLAFWVGCRVCRRKVTTTPEEEKATKPERSQVPLAWAIALFAVSLAVKIYVTNNYGWGYGLDLDVYIDNLALMQVLANVSELGVMALAIACIETCYHPHSQFRKVIFVIIFLNEVFWGALSGMKQNVLRNFLLVAAIVTLTRAKIEKKWVAAVLLGFVVVYPVQNRYRSLLRGGTVDVRQVGALQHAAHTAAEETVQQGGWGGWLQSGWIASVERLDLLQSMAVTSSLDPWQASRVRGDERWWMLPFYPFVPRFLWPSKPILARGQKLSLVLGSTRYTSTALTYPGDLYMDYGVGGILIGMLALGMGAQLIANRVTGRPRKADVFFYSGLFLLAINVFEADAFSVWASLIKALVMLAVMTYLIYGSRPRELTVQTDAGVAKASTPPTAYAARP